MDRRNEILANEIMKLRLDVLSTRKRVMAMKKTYCWCSEMMTDKHTEACKEISDYFKNNKFVEHLEKTEAHFREKNS